MSRVSPQDYYRQAAADIGQISAAYSVPRRFGLGSMLAFTTLFAMLFGLLRYHDAPVSLYLFFGVLGAAVCGAQMWSKEVPRLVSIVAGAICLPAFAIVGGWFDSAMDFVMAPCLAIPGAIFGYLAGTLSAGVFLVADLAERRVRGLDIIDAEVVPEAKLPTGTPFYAPDSCTPYLGQPAAKIAGESPMDGKLDEGSRVKKLGPPVGVPVYNCVALVSPRGEDGLVHVRAGNIADLRTSGATEREALQHLVGAFKIIVSQCLAEGREVPLLAEPHAPAPGETQRFIAVHL